MSARPAKKVAGRKPGIITDTLDSLLAVIVTAASVSDNTIGKDRITTAAAHRRLPWRPQP